MRDQPANEEINAENEEEFTEGRCSMPTCSTRQKKIGLLAFSVLYIPLFAGAFFGFGPMQIMLEESGAFASLCNVTTVTENSTQSDEDVCPEQTARLLTIPFIGQLMILTSPVLGVVVDRFGPVALMSFLGFCGCFGVAMLLAAVTIPIDNLLFLAFVFIGLMSSASSIMTVKTGMVFADDIGSKKVVKSKDDNISAGSDRRENKHQSRVISILNALFDAGSVTYLGLWGISEVGPSISSVFGVYLILAVVCFGGTIIFWVALGDTAFPSASAECTESDVNTEEEEGERRTTLDTLAASALIAQQDVGTRERPGEKSGSMDHLVGDTASSDEPSGALAPHPSEPQQAEPSTDYVPVCERTPKEQLLSLPFVMLVVFFSINLARNQFVLTTARDFLGYLGDEETSKQYLVIFTLLMPASILGLPFTDQVIARYGFHAGLQTICLLAAVHGIVQVSCDELNGVQIFGFVVFSFYRCFLFSIVFSYLPTLLNVNVVGKGVGAMYLAGGLFSFLNIPLSNVTVKHLDGNFFLPNLLYTILVIPCSVAAWMIGKSIQKESLAKQGYVKP